jgi:YHS domain-containing protein
MQFPDMSGQSFEMPNDEQVQGALNPNIGNFSANDPNVARDPVCGLLVVKNSAPDTFAAPVNVPGQETLYFCSARCKALFEQDPAQYGYTNLG